MEEVERWRGRISVKGVDRVNMLFTGGGGDVETLRKSRYGLGRVRSLEEAEEWFGLDFEGKKMLENRCGNLVWKKYEYEGRWEVGDEGGLEENLRRPIWDEEVKIERGEGSTKEISKGLRGQTGPAEVSYDDKENNMMIIVGLMVVVMMVGFILRGRKGKNSRLTN